MNNEFKIINFLGKNHDKRFTMHNLSNKTKIPYATLYRTIKKSYFLLDIEEIGKSKLVSLKKQDSLISFLTVSSELEKNIYLKNQPLMRRIAKKIEKEKAIVILFGSYASNNYNKNSDIDILIISRRLKKKISFLEEEFLFKKKINEIFLTKSEFIRAHRQSSENLVKQVIKNHVLLTNPEEFWRLVFHEKVK